MRPPPEHSALEPLLPSVTGRPDAEVGVESPIRLLAPARKQALRAIWPAVADRRPLAFSIEQTNPRRSHFVQQPLRKLTVFAHLNRPQMRHLPVGGIVDHIGVGLEQRQAEQPIVVRWLLFRPDTEPNMIRIEIIRHSRPSRRVPCVNPTAAITS